MIAGDQPDIREGLQRLHDSCDVNQCGLKEKVPLIEGVVAEQGNIVVELRQQVATALVDNASNQSEILVLFVEQPTSKLSWQAGVMLWVWKASRPSLTLEWGVAIV